VTKNVPVDRPGKRTHLGFMAPDLKRAFDVLGMDFGGYVETPDGELGLRPDQQIPILWKAVQELTTNVLELRKMLADLQGRD